MDKNIHHLMNLVNSVHPVILLESKLGTMTGVILVPETLNSAQPTVLLRFERILS
jgi:hypothetical protein